MNLTRPDPKICPPPLYDWLQRLVRQVEALEGEARDLRKELAGKGLVSGTSRSTGVTIPVVSDPQLSPNGAFVGPAGATLASTSTGAVTSVNADGGSTGYAFTGGPVTSSGTLTLTVSSAATARSAISAAQKTAVGAHTITIPKLTSGGTDGSVSWNADGSVSAYVDPT